MPLDSLTKTKVNALFEYSKYFMGTSKYFVRF